MSYELKSAKELTEIAKRTTDYNTLHQMLCYACDKRKSLDARGKAYRANLWNKAHNEIEARFIALFPPDDVVESPIIKPARIVNPKPQSLQSLLCLPKYLPGLSKAIFCSVLMRAWSTLNLKSAMLNSASARLNSLLRIISKA